MEDGTRDGAVRDGAFRDGPVSESPGEDEFKHAGCHSCVFNTTETYNISKTVLTICMACLCNSHE